MTDPGFERAHGAVIEIVERRPPGDYDNVGGDIIVPTEVRINGQSLLGSADHPVRVHEVSVKDGDCVMVTLTLFAKRVSFHHEDDGPVNAIPVALRVGRGDSHEIGTVESASAVPALLRAVADQMDAEQARSAV